MTPPPPSSDPSARDASEPATARNPRSGAAESTFDAAQELLQAALDGVRTGGEAAAPTPAPAPAPKTAPTPKTAPAPKGSPRPPSAPAVPAAAPKVSSHVKPGPANNFESAEFWAEPVPRPESTARSNEPVGRGRSRRRQSAPVPTSSTDEFDGLTDTLFQPTTGGTRRRRRPASGPATAIGATAAVSAVAPTGAPSPVTKEPAIAPIPIPASFPDLGEAVVGSPVSRPTESPGTAAWELTAAELANSALRGPSPLPTAATDEWGQAPRRRTTWVVAAAIVAVVAVVALGLVLTGGGGSDEAAVISRGTAQLKFAPITTPEGATVTRSWELEGRKGSEFVGTLAFSNPTSAPVLATFTEVIPKSLATDVSQITFDPRPIVVKADPVVQYRLTVPAGATTTATYEIAVAPDGVDRRRLEAWAEDLPVEPTTTTSTTAPALLPTAAAPTEPAPAPAPGRPNNPNVTPIRPTNPPAPTTTPTSPPEPPPTSPPEPPPTSPPVQKGTIVIQVITRGSESGTFGYSTPAGAISLTTSGGSASWSSVIDPGTYTLAQTSTPSYFYLYEIRCSNGFASRTTSASITVRPGETISCTFENRPT